MMSALHGAVYTSVTLLLIGWRVLLRQGAEYTKCTGAALGRGCCCVFCRFFGGPLVVSGLRIVMLENIICVQRDIISLSAC